ncbi:hypothetical protein COT49_02430 [candidate division WWE3 bacterium CG08_land_8_20_14_0_20_40_13]|uniref:Uncharacterized protein n=1 Tax=candidate division WWE3 bacterium CG08_land_8_20_14_0_20_40_13 TaxID=1975084 RepID=A0A2H0XFV0_UNCKA|nr:MAG: hypothetical protein COT49_02430 [candidate division WWE3 bacterium CG08_land_8_20_14_0_20_40_13]
MIQKISAPISVLFWYSHKAQKAEPLKLFWDGVEYPVSKIGLHYSYRQGRTLFHVFSVLCQDTFFKIVLNTDNLFWRLEEIADYE